jgi:5-methylcytosine-specific restriction protein A
MSWGFDKGRVYNRQADIHAQFKGQPQGGIITPADHALVIVITGEEGLAHGYADRWRPDGVFEYFGEGQTGDMTLVRRNKALLNHSAEGKSLLLFRKSHDGLEDEMVYETHHIERALDSHGNERDAIVFELRPLSAIVEGVEATESVPPSTNLDDLRRRAYAAAGTTHLRECPGFETSISAARMLGHTC